jgi:hypothetical protein
MADVVDARAFARAVIGRDPSEALEFGEDLRVVWPKTTPANAEYWRMTQTPE